MAATTYATQAGKQRQRSLSRAIKRRKNTESHTEKRRKRGGPFGPITGVIHTHKQVKRP